MSVITQASIFISPIEYLEGEECSATKHEYLNGVAYAMAGGTLRHGIISGNIFSALRTRLRGKGCRPFNADTLVHLRHGDDERFYYPDVSVVCGPIQPESRTLENPVVIFEVLSPSTERHDRGEKQGAYLRCDSLQAYLLIHTERPEVTLYTRQSDTWEITRYNELTDTLPLPCIGTELPMGEVYEE